MSGPVHQFQAPEWLVAAVTERMTMLDLVLGDSAAAYPIILLPLTEPEEGASPAVFERWERSCDNCQTHCPAGTDFYTGTAPRTLRGTQVVITYGMCADCAEVG